MNSARIAYIEDDPTWHRLIDAALENSPHRIYERAYTMIEAKALLGRIAAEETGIDVILLDGALSKNTVPGAHARELMNDIREVHRLVLPVVGFSGFELTGLPDPVPVDIDLTKNRAIELAAVLDQL